MCSDYAARSLFAGFLPIVEFEPTSANFTYPMLTLALRPCGPGVFGGTDG